MSWWEDHVVPRIADNSLGTEAVRQRRESVCDGLHGRVLEIGFGSRAQRRAVPAEVTEVHAVEPSDVGWRLAGRASEQRRCRCSAPGLDGQRLTEPDDAFDCVLTTFSLCTIPDQRAALAEVRRVLRPGGALHFLEHGLSPDAGWRGGSVGSTRCSDVSPGAATSAATTSPTWQADRFRHRRRDARATSPDPHPASAFGYLYLGTARPGPQPHSGQGQLHGRLGVQPGRREQRDRCRSVGIDQQLDLGAPEHHSLGAGAARDPITRAYSARDSSRTTPWHSSS